MRRHLVSPLPSEFGYHVCGVNWKTFVRVDGHTEQTGVCLEQKTILGESHATFCLLLTRVIH